MRSLRELQQDFADALAGPEHPVPAFAPTPGGSTTERFAIYRRAVHANYFNALSATYPVVRRLVGTAFFRAAVNAYVRAHPSLCGDLNVYGDAFGAFLAHYTPAVDLAYLPDVARLEWAIDEAQRATDTARAPDLVLAALSQVPAERLTGLRFRLAPSCRLVGSDYPILRIWRVNQPDHDGDDRVGLDESADRLLVRRDARGATLERLSAGEFAWLRALQADATLAAAIETAQHVDAGFDLGDALRTHIGNATLSSIAAD